MWARKRTILISLRSSRRSATFSSMMPFRWPIARMPRSRGLATKLPSYAGRTMQAELEALTKVLETPSRPLAAIVGGAKVSTKLGLLRNLLGRVNVLIIGGGVLAQRSTDIMTQRGSEKVAGPQSKNFVRSGL